MGEVYRARDARLNRDVAIKVLPEAFAADAERLARFTREAQTLAALNHPNIAHLHGLEEASGVRALVMELVEGEDLSARIGRGPLPLAEAIGIARQIADALEAAHDKGIVHRDLKPANIKVRTDDGVKVLDFGLAKALNEGTEAGGGSGAAATESPTLTAAAFAGGTQLGLILGTAAYMAPEQARGKTVDKRADVWAFGVVLFEMLTGERLFKGDEVSDVLAAVLRQDVAWSKLPAATPFRLRHLLERCLDRDSRTRLRDIGEARVELARIAGGDAGVSSAARETPRPGRLPVREVVAWTTAAAAVAVAAAAWLTRPAATSETAAGELTQLTFMPPARVVSDVRGAQVSPDGKKLLFSGAHPDGRQGLWLRNMATLEVTALPDTADAIEPFWSPDSKSIAFGAQGKLKRLDLGATRAQVLTDAARLNNGSWSHRGVIVFSPDFGSNLYRVSADGGPRTPATARETGDLQTNHRYPYFLPDGRHFLYFSGRRILVGLLDSPDTKEILPDFAPAIYAQPGFLIYVRNGTFVAHGFDADRLALSGEPMPVASLSQGTTWELGARASVSNNGVLVIQDAPVYEYQLAWYDRSGTQVGLFGPPRMANVPSYPRLSPDDSRVVMQVRDPALPGGDLWIGNVERRTIDRFTTTPELEQLPLWSLDGKSLFCNSGRNRIPGVYRLPVSDATATMVVRGTVFPSDLSADGRWLFFSQRGETTRSDIWMLAVDGKPGAAPAPRVAIQTTADESYAQVSPDSRWVAYVSDLSGDNEVYVRQLKADGSFSEAERVSIGGGGMPRWSRDGRELIYVNWTQGNLSAQVMTIALRRTGTSVEFAPPKPMFKVRMLRGPTPNRDYDVTRDGQRFLIGTVIGDTQAMPATVVMNWTSALKR
jgi:Tol biopolymer transport system component